MNKPKHTPGPWNVENEWISGDGDRNNAVVHLEYEDARVSAEDARLIAAAPELLEALTALFQASPHDMSDTLEAFRARQRHNPAVRANELNDKFADALLKAQAAIAKATGGAE